MTGLSRFNPFPGAVWTFLLLALILGYFIGFVAGSFAVENNYRNTLNYLEGLKRK